MDTSKAWMVICITVFLVVGVNAWIYAAVSRRGSIGQIELLRRATQRAKDPWQGEDNDLAELSRLVKDISKPPQIETSAHKPDMPDQTAHSRSKLDSQE